MLISSIQAHPSKARLVRRWKGKQFPLFDRLGELIEGRYATGKYVVHAGAEAASSPVIPAALDREETDDDVRFSFCSALAYSFTYCASTGHTHTHTHTGPSFIFQRCSLILFHATSLFFFVSQAPCSFSR